MQTSSDHQSLLDWKAAVVYSTHPKTVRSVAWCSNYVRVEVTVVCCNWPAWWVGGIFCTSVIRLCRMAQEAAGACRLRQVILMICLNGVWLVWSSACTNLHLNYFSGVLRLLLYQSQNWGALVCLRAHTVSSLLFLPTVFSLVFICLCLWCGVGFNVTLIQGSSV